MLSIRYNNDNTINESTPFYGIYKLIADNQQAATTFISDAIDIIAEWLKQQFEFWVAEIQKQVYLYKKQQNIPYYNPYLWYSSMISTRPQ